MKNTDRFITGFRTFQKEYFDPQSPRFESLKQGQKPRTMFIACSDSRVDPAILTNCAPGDIFTVRNVANLVPPYEKDAGHHGISAALEFAVCNLEIESIIVMGHSGCGGIKALMDGTCDQGGGGFVCHWMEIAAPAREKALANLSSIDSKLQIQAVERTAIQFSLANLRTFPFIQERIETGRLHIHGWYFDLETGELLEYDQTSGAFEIVSDA